MQRIIEFEIAYVPGAEAFKFFLPVMAVNRNGEKEQKYREIGPTPHIAPCQYLYRIVPERLVAFIVCMKRASVFGNQSGDVYSVACIGHLNGTGAILE